MIESEIYKARILQGLDWWLTGLSYCIPERLLKIYESRKHRLFIEIDPHCLQIRQFQGQKNLAENRFLLEDCEQSDIDKVKSSFHDKGSTEYYLLIDDNKVIKTSFLLPKTTLDNISKVLIYEIPRQTPFNVENIYFDYKIDKKYSIEKIQVSLYITPDYVIHDAESIAIKFDLDSYKVTSKNLYESNPNINLLPHTTKTQVSTRSKSFISILVLLNMLLFAFILYFPVMQKMDYVEQLDIAVNNQKKKALQTRKLEEKYEKLISKSRFMNQKRGSNIFLTELLNETSRIIPTDTWISQFSVISEKNTVELHGYTNNASSVIKTLEASEHYQNPEFSAPVISNSLNNKDEFTITANMVKSYKDATVKNN